MRGLILSVASWIAILTMFGYISWNLAKQFDYIEPLRTYLDPNNNPTYTNQAFESLVYEHYMNSNQLGKCEEVIEDILKVDQ